MEKLNYADFADKMLKQISETGAFLTSSANGKANTMTISWGGLFFCWSKPTFIAPVRHSRYTRELLEESQVFTVSVPVEGEMLKELGFMGTKSGRDMDKYEACGLKLRPGRTVDCPVVDGSWLCLECKVVASTDTCAESYIPEIADGLYADKDFHKLYYGEIVDSYLL